MKKIVRFFRSMTFGVVLLCLTLVCGFAGTLISQNNDPAWYAESYGAGHRVILALGLDDVFGSWYFIALLALLCLDLAVCCVICLIKAVKSSRTAAADAAGREVQAPMTAAEAGAVREHLAARWKKHDAAGVSVYSRSAAGWYGPFVTHFSILLLVIVGALAVYLPTVTDRHCIPGGSITMKDGAVISVQSFSAGEGGGLLDHTSDLEITLPGGMSSGVKHIAVDRPVSFGRYEIYQQTYGTAGAVHVRELESGEERDVLLNEMLFLSLDGGSGAWFEALYAGHTQDEAGVVTLTASEDGTYPDPIYQIILASGGVNTPELVFPGERVTVGGMELTFLAPLEYPILRIRTEPELVMWLVCAAVVPLIAGLWLCFFRRPALVTVTDEGYAVTGPRPQKTVRELQALLGGQK